MTKEISFLAKYPEFKDKIHVEETDDGFFDVIITWDVEEILDK